MLRRKSKFAWIMTLTMTIFPSAVALGDVLMLCLDTSQSMKSHNKFSSAKAALIQQIEEAPPGDVIYVIAFDTNDYPVGRMEVGEDGSSEAKAQLITKVRTLRATGRWTNIDEPLQAAKALLLEERAAGARKIIILSDGLSDPSPDHVRLDLQGIGQMIPQELGWSVYLVGLPDDIAGLFQTQPHETAEIISAPESPQIKGIALQQFSREKIGEAVKVVKEDVLPSASASVAPPVPVQVAQETPASLPQTSTPDPSATSADAPTGTPLPLSWLLGATLLAILGGAVLFLPRRDAKSQITSFTLDVQEGETDSKQFPLTLNEGDKKTIGTKGDVPLSDPDLPAVVCTLHSNKGQLYLTPRDTIGVNGQPVIAKTPVGVGDRITVREKTIITINEGGVNL